MSGGRRIVVERGLLAAGVQRVRLGEDAARYALRVLRLEPGAAVTVLDGEGWLGRGRLRVEGEAAEVELEALERCAAGESALELEVWCAVPKGDRQDGVVQKLTELGVRRLVPLETARSDVRIPADRVPGRVTRWQRIADEAARQCRRTRAAEIAAPMTLAEALAAAGAPAPDELRLTGWTGPEARPLRHLFDGAASPRRVIAAIGPEGGLTAAEAEALARAGFQRASLGERVLRVDTAAIMLAGLAQHLAGDLG